MNLKRNKKIEDFSLLVIRPALPKDLSSTNGVRFFSLILFLHPDESALVWANNKQFRPGFTDPFPGYVVKKLLFDLLKQWLP